MIKVIIKKRSHEKLDLPTCALESEKVYKLIIDQKISFQGITEERILGVIKRHYDASSAETDSRTPDASPMVNKGCFNNSTNNTLTALVRTGGLENNYNNDDTLSESSHCIPEELGDFDCDLMDNLFNIDLKSSFVNSHFSEMLEHDFK